MINKKSKNGKEVDEASSLSNNINIGTKVKGEIEAQGNLRIDGELEGDVSCKAKLVLGQTSEVKGTIDAQNAEVAGRVVGTVNVSEILVLKATAHVTGDISADKLMIETGAVFNGTSKMGTEGKQINLDDEIKRGKEKSA